MELPSPSLCEISPHSYSCEYHALWALMWVAILALIILPITIFIVKKRRAVRKDKNAQVQCAHCFIISTIGMALFIGWPFVEHIIRG